MKFDFCDKKKWLKIEETANEILEINLCNAIGYSTTVN